MDLGQSLLYVSMERNIFIAKNYSRSDYYWDFFLKCINHQIQPGVEKFSEEFIQFSETHSWIYELLNNLTDLSVKLDIHEQENTAEYQQLLDELAKKINKLTDKSYRFLERAIRSMKPFKDWEAKQKMIGKMHLLHLKGINDKEAADWKKIVIKMLPQLNNLRNLDSRPDVEKDIVLFTQILIEFSDTFHR